MPKPKITMITDTQILKTLTLAILALSVLLFLPSCIKDRQYKFVVKNNTNFRLDKIEFTCSVNPTQIEVEPNSISTTFIVTYDRGIYPARFFTEPQLCVFVRNYSDTTGNYEGGLGTSFNIKDLLKKGTNTVQVNLELNPTNPNDIFSFKLNN